MKGRLTVTSAEFDFTALPYKRLLADGWRVTHWQRGETRYDVSVDIDLLAAIVGYETAVRKELFPVRWVHPQRGVAEWDSNGWTDTGAIFAEYGKSITRPKYSEKRKWQVGDVLDGKVGDIIFKRFDLCAYFRPTSMLIGFFSYDGKNTTPLPLTSGCITKIEAGDTVLEVARNEVLNTDTGSHLRLLFNADHPWVTSLEVNGYLCADARVLLTFHGEAKT